MYCVSVSFRDNKSSAEILRYKRGNAVPDKFNLSEQGGYIYAGGKVKGRPINREDVGVGLKRDSEFYSSVCEAILNPEMRKRLMGLLE